MDGHRRHRKVLPPNNNPVTAGSLCCVRNLPALVWQSTVNHTLTGLHSVNHFPDARTLLVFSLLRRLYVTTLFLFFAVCSLLSAFFLSKDTLPHGATTPATATTLTSCGATRLKEHLHRAAASAASVATIFAAEAAGERRHYFPFRAQGRRRR